MLSVLRLCSKNSWQAGFRPISSATPVLAVIMRKENFKPVPEESYDKKNMDLDRPLSPHLTIYKPQLTSMLSITHRMTGLFWGFLCTGIGLASMFKSGDFSLTAGSIHQSLGPSSITLMRLTILFPVIYHYVNGIRHLIWDFGQLLTLQGVYASGYAVLGLSILLSLIVVMSQPKKEEPPPVDKKGVPLKKK